MEMDILRAELERLFELDELLSLSRDVLALDPEVVGGTAGKGSFARALTQHCAERDAVEALCDALIASKPGVDPKVAQLRQTGPSQRDEIPLGESVGECVVLRKLGEGPAAISYQARRDDRDVRLKVLRREAARDRRELNRFLALTRIAAGLHHPSLPHGLQAGEANQRFFVLHDYVDGQALAARIARTGPMHINEARDVLAELLRALAALHAHRLTHGNLKLENIILARTADGQQRLLLIDAGGDRIRARHALNGRGALSTISNPKTVAPEQLRGELPTPVSDLYSFGAVMFEVLTGKPLFTGRTGIEALIAHLTEQPPAPSAAAPRGWVPTDVDQFVLRLLEKDPNLRPRTAEEMLDRLTVLGRPTLSPPTAQISEEELIQRIDAVLGQPEDQQAATRLESSIEEGGDAEKVADAFAIAADQVEGEEEASKIIKKALLYRAGRIYQDKDRNLDAAEKMYADLVALDPSDEAAQVKLEDIRRRLGKYEELIEALLEKVERAPSGEIRAGVFARIGKLYASELEDTEQAIVAYTQAFCEDPLSEEYVTEIERLCGNSREAWEEVLGTCTEASTREAPPEVKNPLFLRMGRWYGDKYGRSDLALSCFQAILTSDPAHEGALDGLTRLYRKAQQWQELAATLLRRADATGDPARARDLRCEAAEVRGAQLNDVAGARELFRHVLTDDPSHPRASEALGKILEWTGDHAGYVKLLEHRADALRGEEQLRVYCRIAEVHELRLGNDAEAVRRYLMVLGEDGDNLDALRGLDRLYSKAGRFRDLLNNLHEQVRLATTPRQKIALWERIAGIQDEEFFDHREAANAFEEILSLDPDHEPSLSALARHYQALERWEDLAELYERHFGVVSEQDRKLGLAVERARVLSEHMGATDRAIEAYEKVLSIQPQHPTALESLARLRETAGHQDAALEAIGKLAEKAETPEGKAEQYVRAARLLESRGELQRAIDDYKRALDASPKDRNISAALRNAYVARGDVNAAIALIEHEISDTDGDRQKAKLAAEMAVLCFDKLKDEARADRAARRALDYDPTNTNALTLLADAAFDADRFVEATSFYEKLSGRTETLAHDAAVRVLLRFVDSLAKSGSTERALAAMDTLLRLAPDDPSAVQCAAAVTFEHGSAKQAHDRYQDLLSRLGDRLGQPEKAVATYRLGESARRTGDIDTAITVLEEASDLDPSSSLPLIALASAYEAKGQWEKVVDTKTRLLDLADGDERVKLLIEVGEIAAGKLADRTLAAKSLVAAVDERPDDRKLLMRLMQLYSEEKDWQKLIDVVMKLADFVDDAKQKAKYLQTAAVVAGREMGDLDRALDFLLDVRKLDPANEKAVDDSIEFIRLKGDHELAVDHLKEKAKLASEAKNTARMLDAFTELGGIYKDQLGRIGHAIDAYEAAQTLDPDNRERNELLAELYASDPEKYLEKAVAAQMAMLRINPYREPSYKLLRRLYTESKRADPAWCLCQALYVLKLSDGDEERFFKRMRSEDPAYAQDVIRDEDWLNLLLHSDADPLLTTVLALIEPGVIATRGQAFEELGYDEAYSVDPSQHPYPLSQTLHYAAGVMGMECPPTFENREDAGGLSFLHARTPSIVLGNAALTADIPPQAAAFIAARHLAYYRPGMYIRHLVPFGHGLKSWLFAAIKMNARQFPIAHDIEGPVTEAMRALETHLSPQVRDHLARVVSRLLQSGRALDLKKWVQGIDLTADRIGFVLSHDLETAVEIIRHSDEVSSALNSQQRLRELVLFAISERYFKLRERLQITIDM